MAFDWESPTNSVEDTAALIGCSTWCLYGLIRRGQSPVPVIHVGRKIRVITAGVRRVLLLDDRNHADTEEVPGG
jgi:hypothetical protein